MTGRVAYLFIGGEPASAYTNNHSLVSRHKITQDEFVQFVSGGTLIMPLVMLSSSKSERAAILALETKLGVELDFCPLEISEKVRFESEDVFVVVTPYGLPTLKKGEDKHDEAVAKRATFELQWCQVRYLEAAVEPLSLNDSIGSLFQAAFSAPSTEDLSYEERVDEILRGDDLESS